MKTYGLTANLEKSAANAELVDWIHTLRPDIARGNVRQPGEPVIHYFHNGMPDAKLSKYWNDRTDPNTLACFNQHTTLAKTASQGLSKHALSLKHVMMEKLGVDFSTSDSSQNSTPDRGVSAKSGMAGMLKVNDIDRKNQKEIAEQPPKSIVTGTGSIFPGTDGQPDSESLTNRTESQTTGFVVKDEGYQGDTQMMQDKKKADTLVSGNDSKDLNLPMKDKVYDRREGKTDAQMPNVSSEKPNPTNQRYAYRPRSDELKAHTFSTSGGNSSAQVTT